MEDRHTGTLAAARTALQAGEGSRAAALAEQVLRAEPGNVTALLLAGLAHQSVGNFALARSFHEALTRLRPRDVAPWVNLGTSLRHLGNLDAAFSAYATGAALGATGADFLFNVALLHKERGDYPHAHRLLREARVAAPLDTDIRLQLAQCCQEMLRLDEAAETLADWPTFSPLDDALLAQIALQLLNLGDKRGADAAVAQLRRGPAPGPLAQLRLGQMMERTNQVEEASACLAAVAGFVRPEHQEEVRLLEGQLAQRTGRHQQAVSVFEGLAAEAEPHRRHLALFPLARSQQAIGNHAAAWETLRQAHAAQLLQLRRSHPDVAAQQEPPLLITRRPSNAADIARWRDLPGPSREASPVFIVAFPRSGTTLLEQALDAHPALQSMDEQPYLQQVIDRIGDFGVDYPAGLAALNEAQLEELRGYYWSLVRGKVELLPGQRLVDKNPLNLLRLAAIRRLFPQAAVIVAIRHPLDVVLSCFTQHFRAPEFALLCRDPATLARGFRRCFEFWYAEQQLLGADVLEVRYEKLVADFTPGMRAIAEFLQLPWDEAMARPGERATAKGYISTPSYAQVIEPVSTRAIGKWQPYREQLAEAAIELSGCMSRWGYAL